MTITNAAFVCFALVTGGAPAPKNPPAKVEHAANGGTITLKPEAEKRLAITLGKIEKRSVRDVLVRSGRIDTAPGGRGPIVAPVAGTILPPPGKSALLLPGANVTDGQIVMRLLPLVAPDRNLEVEAKRDYELARARLDMAEKRAVRMKTLLKEGAVDVAALEQAQTEHDVAKAELEAAKKRVARAARNPMAADVSLSLRAPHAGVLMSSDVANGQAVTQGSVLFEVVAADALWVQVPVFVGALTKIDEDAKATVRVLGTDVRRSATRIKRPPVAGAGSAVAVFYALDDTDGLSPGLRATVELPLHDAGERLVAPWSSIVWDENGGTWVYARTAELTYTRKRVQVARIVGEHAVLDAGPDVGTEVATAGVMELYGTETGIGK
ncbi:MAG: HlyD family efflux transporter periplasmic adaptor subunit [Deltaproteobacteria bacterium]|jgi:multidrug efflux pump subunit AcrA (membrane-fusion protein)